MIGRLRVLHVIPGLADRYGGPSRVVTALAAALMRQGCEVLVASTDADGSGRLAVPLGVETLHAGVPAMFFPRRGGDGFKYSPELARWLRSGVAGFDVVHIHAVFSHSSIAAARSCWRAGVPYMLRPLGTLAPWALDQKRWQKRVLLELAGHRMLARAARTHYTTVAEQRETESTCGPTNAVVIPAGLDDDWFTAAGKNEIEREPIVLAMSRLHPVKNLEAAIAAFHLAAPRTGHWTLVLAGDGDAAYRRTLERAADNGPARGRIRFTGWLDRGEAKDWLARASLFLQVSHQESFGVAVLEALASGVPVVASSGVALADEVVGAGAGWRTSADAASIADTLTEAIGDEPDRHRRSAAARALARQFTWTEIAARMTDVYRDIVSAPSRAGMHRAS